MPTRDPDSTIASILEFLDDDPAPIGALGLASFGPIDPEPDSPTYGRVLSTPKPGWSKVDLLGGVRRGIGDVPAAVCTDVVGAAVAAHAYGSSKQVSRFAYITVGTGIGAGILIGGRPIMGAGYPEVAHLHVRRAGGDEFPGVCRFHGACAEGLASGPALAARFGKAPETFTPQEAENAAHLVGHYVGQIVASLAYTLGLSDVVCGGGVTKMSGAVDAIDRSASEWVDKGGGIPHVQVAATEHGDDAGVLGAMLLASRKARKGGSGEPGS